MSLREGAWSSDPSMPFSLNGTEEFFELDRGLDEDGRRAEENNI